MSDFTNDMRYPKRGSVQFDTKDRVDILISKTGDTRSMNIVYSDPETGEILQTSEGGGGGGDVAYYVTSTDTGFWYNGLAYTESGLFAALNAQTGDMPDIIYVSENALLNTYTFASKGADMGGPYFIYNGEGGHTMRLTSRAITIDG